MAILESKKLRQEIYRGGFQHQITWNMSMDMKHKSTKIVKRKLRRQVWVSNFTQDQKNLKLHTTPQL